MRQADRFSVILEDLSDGGSVSVTELCRRLGVSAATIRRDLGLLEENQLLKRTHGGAVSQGLLYELPLRYKSGRHQEEKRRIANAVAELVARRRLDRLHRAGRRRPRWRGRSSAVSRLTIVTNALNIASELAVRPNLRLVVTGGVARSASYELVGPLAEASLAGDQPGHGDPGRRRHLRRRRPHHPPRGGGPHEPRVDRARAPR